MSSIHHDSKLSYWQKGATDARSGFDPSFDRHVTWKKWDIDSWVLHRRKMAYINGYEFAKQQMTLGK